MVLAATLAEPLTESLFVGILAASGLKYLLHLPPIVFLPVHFLAWLYVDMDVLASLAGHAVPADKRWRFIGAWVLRELLALPIWTAAMIGNEVEWRGQRYEVMENGEVQKASNERRGIFGRLWGFGRKNADYYEPLDMRH